MSETTQQLEKVERDLREMNYRFMADVVKKAHRRLERVEELIQQFNKDTAETLTKGF